MDLNEKPHRNIDIRFIIGVLVVVLIISSVFFIKNSGDNNKFASQDTRIDAPKEKAKQTINKDFDFSIKDNSGKEIAKLKYT
ncbi:MAG: hypothetical protein M1326_03690, partial [Cyanobacteria bacterium]|nr:hypothetical protein [Cyanobacteriota bacterium]